MVAGHSVIPNVRGSTLIKPGGQDRSTGVLSLSRDLRNPFSGTARLLGPGLPGNSPGGLLKPNEHGSGAGFQSTLTLTDSSNSYPFVMPKNYDPGVGVTGASDLVAAYRPNFAELRSMGNLIQSTSPDLLSRTTKGEDVSATPLSPSTTAEPHRHFLPKNLPASTKGTQRPRTRPDSQRQS